MAAGTRAAVWLGGWLATLWLAVAQAAAPGGIAVIPVRVELSPARTTSSLQVSNGTDTERRFQIEALRWTRVNGEDRFEPADELVVNPPLFRLKAGAAQVVRVGLLDAVPSTVEGAYRIYISEVPDGTAPPDNQLRVLMRFGVPVFVAPQTKPQPALQWSARHDASGYALTALNPGNVHERRASLTVRDADSGRVLWQQDGFRDLLAGGDRYTWRFTADGAVARTLRIEALTDTGAADAEVDVQTH